MTAIEVLAAQSAPMKVWLAWMFAANFASVFFLRRVPARWVLAAMAANVVSMQLLLRLYGTGHQLSLPHIVFWTPLLIYLFIRRNSLLAWSPFGVWCVLLFLTDLASLVLDYAAIIKLLLRA
jgi:hypothetical protein